MHRERVEDRIAGGHLGQRNQREERDPVCGENAREAACRIPCEGDGAALLDLLPEKSIQEKTR